MNRWRSRTFSWEDGALVALTLVWILAGGGMSLFHLYTVLAMLVVLSLGYRRGLLVALSRAAGISAVLFIFRRLGHHHDGFLLTEIVLLAGASSLAGIFGNKERKARQALGRSFCQTLEALTRALEARDSYTEGHSRRSAQYALAIADAMRIDEESMMAIEQASILHDLGKIGVADAVLRKSGSLTPEERKLMSQHPVIGGRILQGVAFLQEAATLVRHHHEHYDGSGYPDGLKGSAIPEGARILSVADVLDALTTDRPYRTPMTRTEAIQEIEKGSGQLFDPAVIKALKRADLDLPVKSYCPPCSPLNPCEDAA